MEESSNSLDRFFEKVLQTYSNTIWSRFNRTGMGIIGTILLPFAWNLVLKSNEATPAAFIGLTLFSVVVIINALPLTAFVYLFLKQSTNENRLEEDELFLPSIREKVKNGEAITDHETQVYKADIQNRKASGEKLSGVELCGDIMGNEESFEHFLFQTNDAEFIFGLTQLKECLEIDQFDEILSIIATKVPTRMNKFFNKRIDDLHQKLQK